MSRYKLLYLFWLLPAYLLFLTVHQTVVYYSMTDTYENGSIHTAEVVDFDIKQIAAQTNGYVIINFEDGDQTIREKLSLPIELASLIQDLSVIPVRYRARAFQEIVMIPTYEKHRKMVVSNAAMAFIGLLIGIFIAIAAHRYANKRIQKNDRELVIEKIETG